ncbi:hypothetical protein [Dongshaea marina]|uniref:hypothetical protein n=1 Tax=Dongshaea marina TaxID=2047966 RepID=UPI000D3E96DF|nr:hypothetical protein [Dongshaea marina]
MLLLRKLPYVIFGLWILGVVLILIVAVRGSDHSFSEIRADVMIEELANLSHQLLGGHNRNAPLSDAQVLLEQHQSLAHRVSKRRQAHALAPRQSSGKLGLPQPVAASLVHQHTV